MSSRGINSTWRFALPVICENVLVLAATQITSMLIGRISRGSLAAVGLVNSLVAFITAAFAMINVGSAVLISRKVGAGDALGAAEIVEQSASLLTLTSVMLSAALLALAHPALSILMPTAEDDLMAEALIYLRLSALSFPFMMVETLFAAALRAAGNSRGAMALGVGMNALLALCAYIFIILCGWGITGAGLSYLVVRALGALAAVIMTLRYHERFAVRLRGMLRVRPAAWRAIIRMGVPISAESISVQAGYLVANALVVGLGTFNATVFQVASSVNNFSWLPNGICSATAQTMVAMRLGEGDVKQAKKTAIGVWWVGEASVLAISLVMALLSGPMAGIYSSDPAVIAACAPILWFCVAMCVPAVSINTIDPSLRAGGDARFVMLSSLIGVWLVRLPLSWLLAYRLGWGVMGLFVANATSLFCRMILGLVRFFRGRWLH